MQIFNNNTSGVLCGGVNQTVRRRSHRLLGMCSSVTMCFVPYCLYHMPCVMCHVPCALCHVSCNLCHIPCIMYHVLCAIYHVSCVMPCAKCHMQFAVCHVLYTMYCIHYVVGLHGTYMYLTIVYYTTHIACVHIRILYQVAFYLDTWRTSATYNCFIWTLEIFSSLKAKFYITGEWSCYLNALYEV